MKQHGYPRSKTNCLEEFNVCTSAAQMPLPVLTLGLVKFLVVSTHVLAITSNKMHMGSCSKFNYYIWFYIYLYGNVYSVILNLYLK